MCWYSVQVARTGEMLEMHLDTGSLKKSKHNRHLIADHLGWFKEHEGTAGGTLRTVEDLMRAKGEKVTRGRLDAAGVVEYVEE